jgi:ATP-dependent RNA helicase RhlB
VELAEAPRGDGAPEWALDQFPPPPPEGDKVRFHDLDLPIELMHAVADLGFRYCTPIQGKVFTEAAAGRNVAGQAQTGTGKTAAFLIRIFSRFLREPKPGRAKGSPRALVLAPTRELCIQIIKDAELLGKYGAFRCVAVYGGMDFEKQQRQLDRGPVDLVAATPGRLLDFIRRRVISLRQVEVLVIDEADRMLDMGFIPDVRRIIRECPRGEERQTMLFSATLSEPVMRLASQWMPDPVECMVEPEQVAVDTVKQLIYPVAAREKFTLLYNLLRRPEFTRVLVFANRRDATQRVGDDLLRHGVDCEILSGAVPQKKRLSSLNAFCSGKTRVVVATDVAGRGLHVDGISHVINYDFPYEAEDYVHRIGRTGRAGEAGVAISFACEDESFIIPEIEEFLGEPITCTQPSDELLESPPHPSRPRQSSRRQGSGGDRSRRGGSASGGRGGRGGSGRRGRA